MSSFEKYSFSYRTSRFTLERTISISSRYVIRRVCRHNFSRTTYWRMRKLTDCYWSMLLSCFKTWSNVKLITTGKKISIFNTLTSKFRYILYLNFDVKRSFENVPFLLYLKKTHLGSLCRQTYLEKVLYSQFAYNAHYLCWNHCP